MNFNKVKEEAKKQKDESKRKFIADIALELAIQNNTSIELQIHNAHKLARDYNSYVYR